MGIKGINKKIHKICIALCVLILCGCSAESDEAVSQDVELVEPVGNVPQYDIARRRDLSRVSVYQGVVCPDTVEYAYDSDLPFGNFARLPGEDVAEGELLFYSLSEDYDESIEDIEEANLTLLTGFNDYSSDYYLDVAKAKKEEFEASSAYQEAVANAPAEDSPGYAGWAKGVMPLESKAKSAKIAREKLEQAYKERCELFDLEYEYNKTRIQRLEEDRARSGSYSDRAGVVVAMMPYFQGDSIPRGTGIMAVGDTETKEIKCEFVSKAAVSKAVEIFALIDGEKYEVAYENMDPEEYRRIKQKDGDVYTTFRLSDPKNSVTMGKYAVIVVVETGIKDTLCVSKNAVNKDESGTYVYLYDGTESIYTPVTTGESDGSFTQILSGLVEGDRVVCDVPYSPGDKTYDISKGSVHTDFSAEGYLMYSASEWITNPAKSGVCYFNELCVDRYEQITEGQVLARVEVTADNTEIERIRRKIQRQNERIADLNEELKTVYDKDGIELIQRSIRDRNRTIESLNKQLDKLNQYSGIVELKAPYNGIVTEVSELDEGQIISNKEKLVQIARDDSCYIIAEDKNGVLSFGDSATVTGRGISESDPVEGMVVSLNPYGLSGKMRIGYALIKVSAEDMSKISAGGSDNSSGYWSRSRFTVKASSKGMDNVLLIPKDKVYKSGNDTYVIIKNEHGAYELVKFYAGGSDLTNYWVAYGDITEGMTICFE